MVIMVCAGASEQSVSQWASTFAEQGPESKEIGDLAGPMFFAICGSSRLLYGLYGEKLNLKRGNDPERIIMRPLLLHDLALSGSRAEPDRLRNLRFLRGIMWPGAFSIGASVLRGGGTVMFAFFAHAADLGCSGGPTYVGLSRNTRSTA